MRFDPGCSTGISKVLQAPFRTGLRGIQLRDVTFGSGDEYLIVTSEGRWGDINRDILVVIRAKDGAPKSRTEISSLSVHSWD